MFIYILGAIVILTIDRSAKVVLGFTAGAFLGFLLLWLLVWSLKRALVPGNPKGRSFLLKVSAVKYPVVIVGLYFLVSRELVNVLMFCIGFLVVQVGLISGFFYERFLAGRKNHP